MFTGNDIRGLREAINMTPGQFAHLLGIHPATLYRWEAKADEQPRLDPMQLGLLTALRDQLRRRNGQAQEEWVQGLLAALLVGGGLYAIFKILEAVFEEPKPPFSEGGKRTQR